MDKPVNIAVIYYSSTGTIAEIARVMAETAEKTDAHVRLRKVAELAPRAAIDANPAWSANLTATADIPVAEADDIVWADGVLIGSPTRFGNIAAQLKQFLDTLGPVWQQGLLAGKAYSGFTSAGTGHGGHESTLLALSHTFHHFGGIIVPPGYTDPAKFSDGNPYGTSHFDQGGTAPVDDTTRAAAGVQAERLVRYARAAKDA
ncbi:flavodoxin family protein [Paractinoplanes globisporus]|uniref:Flavodoxin family protein n=1 Tax=Paractinoplanes globisporus TaxID=113565 RepID=A0ABW6WI75_9ACTN|nr:NAD(P)H-dependent oxidoreductase [Actinoplanes globisporus]